MTPKDFSGSSPKENIADWLVARAPRQRNRRRSGRQAHDLKERATLATHHPATLQKFGTAWPAPIAIYFMKRYLLLFWAVKANRTSSDLSVGIVHVISRQLYIAFLQRQRSANDTYTVSHSHRDFFARDVLMGLLFAPEVVWSSILLYIGPPLASKPCSSPRLGMTPG